MEAKITGNFINSEGKKRFTALAQADGKSRTGFGDSEDEAKENAINNLKFKPTKNVRKKR